MSNGNPFTKMVPGFDFLQTLAKTAGAAVPGMGQWVAPTLDPDELNKRIEELKTVQFWLEQNARLIGTTIQALEVQRMTLSTLRTMNVSLGDLTESLKIRVPEPAAPPAPAPEPPARARPAATPAPRPDEPDAEAPAAAGAANAPPPGGGAVDPMQWWSALTQQFTELASSALRDGTAASMMQQGVDAAGQAFKAAASIVPSVVPGVMGGAAAAAEAASTTAKGSAKTGASSTARSPAKKPAARKAGRAAAPRKRAAPR